ncbi:hypothetical protein [Leifsonia soli]|uniref:Asp23/Gls24 family envelope stress response protein n=1 Tax=Leifsonia soli TaxID=582665 RepID=A0A852T0I1_9MICO|nr:hypothetical protein [Leifsonia soli]NYD75018.1 hypothetical protein [Leifsonia soli]
MTAGRDRFERIALEHLARAVAADALGVGATDISARVRDESGALAVRLTTPVAVRSLRSGAGEPLAARLTDAGARIRERLAELTGLEVARVDLRATGAVITERRVR